jgi:hypothetical protein
VKQLFFSTWCWWFFSFVDLVLQLGQWVIDYLLECVDTTALLTADPSAKFNTLGFGVDAADIAISFMHNDVVV